MVDQKNNRLPQPERDLLLQVARTAIAAAVRGNPQPKVDLMNMPASFQEDAATFVTLTKNGELRGCIGTMEPYQPLVADVQEHAVAAAMSDFRFRPVSEAELHQIKIEISRLTPLSRLLYKDADDLKNALRIGVDGVLLRAGSRRATFLPQVWEQLPDPEQFLSHLCLKMGAAADFWQDNPMEVFTYQVEEFSEE